MSLVTNHSFLCASDESIDIVLQAISTVISQGKSLPVSISRDMHHCMDTLTLAKGNLLVPGENSSIVVDKIRFLSSSGYLSQLESTTFQSPQTSLEKFLATPSATMTFSQKTTLSTRNVSSVVKHGNLIGGYSKYVILSDSTENGGGDGAVVQVSVSQSMVNYLPGRSPNSTATKVTLSYDSDPGVSSVVVTIPNLTPIHYVDIEPESRNVTCAKKGYAYSISANCFVDPNLNVTCPGNDTRIFQIVCPGKKLVPVCLAWNGEDFIASDACTVIAYTAYNTTCRCVGNTGYDEALGEPSTNNPQIDSIAASADLVVSGFTNTWKSAEDISPSSLTRNKVCKSTACLTIFIIYLFMDVY